MELPTTLSAQNPQVRVREVGINPNYWYPVGWAEQLPPGKTLPVTVWQQAIALYRDREGLIHALEDACPHRGVELHKGEVQGAHLVCPYHGWAFDGEGSCVDIPYWPQDQKLPCARARSFPVQESYGILWVFPGDPNLAGACPIPDIPEFGNSHYLMVPITGNFQVHYSIANENAMDVFHGVLHKNLQGWFDPVLLRLHRSEAEVRADYRVSYRGLLSKILGIGQPGEAISTRTIAVHFQYPHFHSTLEGVSALYLMRHPVSPTHTQSYALLFLKVPLPDWLLRGYLGRKLSHLIRRHILDRFLAQDVEMMESEQRTYLANPRRHYVEINPAILALQRVTVGQYEAFLQQAEISPYHDSEARAESWGGRAYDVAGTESRLQAEPSPAQSRR